MVMREYTVFSLYKRWYLTTPSPYIHPLSSHLSKTTLPQNREGTAPRRVQPLIRRSGQESNLTRTIVILAGQPFYRHLRSDAFTISDTLSCRLCEAGFAISLHTSIRLPWGLFDHDPSCMF